ARRRAARLRRRGDRDAAEADGGQPPPAGGDRRRLPPSDAALPRVESGTPVALLARDRLSGLLDRRAGRDFRPLRRRARVHARRLVQSAPVMVPLNVWDYEALAAERLEAGAHGYYAGGAGDELTLRWNVEAYSRWQLRPRVLVDVGGCTTATTVLGHELSMPLVIAPVAFQRVAHPDGEVGMARAAADVGTAICLSTMSTSASAEVAETGAMRWFQ